MKKTELYSKLDTFAPIVLDDFVYSIDKIRLTFNCGTCSGFSTKIDSVLDYFKSNRYRVTRVKCSYEKYSLSDLARHVHVQIWIEDPKGASTMKVRWEFNPNKMTEEYPACFEWLCKEVYKARGCVPVVVNRIDYACDVPLPLDDVLTLTRKHRADCFDNTRYYGVRGVEELKVYDKKEESHIMDTSFLTRLEWESYNDPLNFQVKEQFCMMSDSIPDVIRYLQPCKVHEYLSTLHHATKKKYLDSMLESRVPVSSAPFHEFSSRIRAWLRVHDIDLTSELRENVTSDLTEICKLLRC